MQVIGPAAVGLSYVDLSGAADPDAAGQAHLAVAAREPFDLARGPLLRATLLRLAPSGTGFYPSPIRWSPTAGRCARCWPNSRPAMPPRVAGYAARVDAVPAQPPDLPIQYGDFALWQRDRWQDGGYADDERYWQDALAGAPATLALPTDRAKRVGQGGEQGREGGRHPAGQVGAHLRAGRGGLERRPVHGGVPVGRRRVVVVGLRQPPQVVVSGESTGLPERFTFSHHGPKRATRPVRRIGSGSRSAQYPRSARRSSGPT
jgi:hypothetical protein